MGKKKVEEDKMTAEEFGEFLRYMRESIGFSQVALATRLGQNKNLYNSYENGVRLPRKWKEIETELRKIAKEVAQLNRESGMYSSLTDEVREEILVLHGKKMNTVQIGMRVGIDEVEVEKFLLMSGESPIIFMPCFTSGVSTDVGVALGDIEEDFEDEFGEDVFFEKFGMIDDEDTVTDVADVSDVLHQIDVLDMTVVDDTVRDLM